MRYHIGRVFSEPDVADLAASRLKRWLEMPRETALSFFDRDPDMDIRPLLSAIRVPTLIAHGTEDRQVPFAAAEYLAAHIPGRSSIPSWATATSRCSPRPRSSATCCARSCGRERSGPDALRERVPFRLPPARGSIVLPNPHLIPPAMELRNAHVRQRAIQPDQRPRGLRRAAAGRRRRADLRQSRHDRAADHACARRPPRDGLRARPAGGDRASPWRTATRAPRASSRPATSMWRPASATRSARSTRRTSPARR